MAMDEAEADRLINQTGSSDTCTQRHKQDIESTLKK